MTSGYYLKTELKGKRYVPVCQVSFHTDNQCYQAFGKLQNISGQLDPTYQVISVDTGKMMDTPAGSINITLVGAEWQERLRPNDLMVIVMGYKGGTPSTVMVGLIDTVTKRRSVGGNGQPDVYVNVVGRDMGKLLLKGLLKFYPEIGASQADKEHKFFLTQDGWQTMMEHFTGDVVTTGSPAVLLDTVMRYIFPKLFNTEWTVWDELQATPIPKKLKPTQIVRYNFAKSPFFLPFVLSLTDWEGPIWNLMERACIKPFMEFFIDTRDGIESWNAKGLPMVVDKPIEQGSTPDKNDNFAEGQGKYHSPAHIFGPDDAKVNVVLRNTPFDNDAWKRLKRHILASEDVIDESISVSDNENYNLFWAGEQLSPFGIDLKRVCPPEFNEDNAKRYGLSPLEVMIEGMLLQEDQTTAQQPLFEMQTTELNKKLKRWFENNHTYQNGSFKVRGNGSYKIGQVLEYPEIGMEFYIEGVSQSFQMFTDWTSLLTVTRGRPISTTTNSAETETAYSPAASETELVYSQEQAETAAGYYTVKSGDTLWELAAKWYGSGAEYTKIIKNNPQITDANHIEVGQIIKK